MGNLRREDHLEAALDDVPAHHTLGAGIENRSGGHDGGAAARALGADQDASGAVSEEAARDQIRDREVLALQRQGAKLDGQERGDPTGMRAHGVRGADEPRRPGDAAEPEDGRPLHVRAEPEALHEPRVDRGRRKPRHGHEDQMLDVRGLEVGAHERGSHRFLAEVRRSRDPGVVAGRERAQLAVAFERQGQMPPRDLHGAVQLLEPRGVEMLLRPGVAEGGDERLLIDVMLGQHRRRAEYVGIHQRATSTGSATRTSSWPSSRSRRGTRKEFFTG